MDGTSPPPRDPFIRKFLTRIPPDVAASFTPAQFDAIKLAFGARDWGAHTVDIRKSFPLFWSSFYLVLLMGRNRRSADRLAAESQPFGTPGNILITVGFVAFLLIPAWFGLYALKSMIGVDLLPASGAHGVVDDLLAQLGRLLG